MSKRENKLHFLTLFFVLLFFYSCNNKDSGNESFEKISVDAATREQYDSVYKAAKDSIDSWVNNNLSSYQMQKNSNWRLDSLICFNNTNNRCVMAIENQENEKVNNSLNYFYGAKLNNNWYFFRGATVVLSSEKYGEQPKMSLSFAKMHEIALKEIFSGYLTPDGEINENFFKQQFENSSCYGCKTKEDFETYYLWLVNNNWKAKPEYRYILEEQKAKKEVLP